jgi:hypothetical protein
MNTSDEYLAYAKDCMQWAAGAKTEDERKAFVEIAQYWTQAALRIEGTLIPHERAQQPHEKLSDWP